MILRQLLLGILFFNSFLWSCSMSAAENKITQIDSMVKHTDALTQEIRQLQGEIAAIQAKKKIKATTGAANPHRLPRHSTTMVDKRVKEDFVSPVFAEMPLNYRNNLATASTPLNLLESRKKESAALKKQGLSAIPSSIEIAGNLIGASSLRRSYRNQNASDINFAAASVSAAMAINPWVTGLIKLNYDAGGVASHSPVPYHIANSRLFLNTGLITIGNFSYSPLYASIGQMVVPFGNYSGLLPTLTSRLGRTLQRAVVLGWQQPNSAAAINAAIYGFTGSTRIYGENRINNGGVSLGYAFKGTSLKFETGVGVIANIADSAGMQNTRAPFVLFDNWTDADESGDEEFGDDDEEEEGPFPLSFSGFGKTAETEIIEHRVPAIDAYVKMSAQNIGIYGEYTGATRSFDINDLSFNHHGARPQAFNIDASYQFKVWNRLMVISAGYSRSSESLALNMPLKTVGMGMRTMLNKHVVAGLIYRHDVAYGRGNYATGTGLPVLADSTLGRSSSSLTAQLGFKF